MKQKAYIILMALLLSSIGIKYEGSNNNPFQHASPSKMVFVTAACCHVLVSAAEMSLPTTDFIFHLSGIVGCEALMWILVDEFVWWYLTNVLLLLVASFCLNDYNHIIDFIRGTRGHVPNLEAQEGQM